MKDLFGRKDVTLVVTDSGLGGLSVAADIVAHLKANGAFRRARVIFFNCKPSNTIGFDAMETDERRCRVFNRALDCLAGRFAPDAILLACNTLSIIYDRTAFAAQTALPVFGIVEMGVDLIADHLERQPDAQAILFATPTTVRCGAHKRFLCERGFAPGQVIYQSCERATSAIERGPHSETTRALIDRYVADALEQVQDLSLPIAASFNCTHFGYAEDVFRQAFQTRGIEPAAVLDPTRRMSGIFLSEARSDRFASPEVTIEVVTQTLHTPERKESIGALIALRSEETAAALRNDTLVPGLFQID